MLNPAISRPGSIGGFLGSRLVWIFRAISSSCWHHLQFLRFTEGSHHAVEGPCQNNLFHRCTALPDRYPSCRHPANELLPARFSSGRTRLMRKKRGRSSITAMVLPMITSMTGTVYGWSASPVSREGKTNKKFSSPGNEFEKGKNTVVRVSRADEQNCREIFQAPAIGVSQVKCGVSDKMRGVSDLPTGFPYRA